MPSTESARSGARALRDAAARLQRRAEPLPRLPFAIAFAMAVVALVVALEFRPGSDAATVKVEELPSSPLTGQDWVGMSDEEADLEIVEYGIGKVTVSGLERLVIGAVVRNPYDQDLMAGELSLTAENDNGTPIRIEDFVIGVIPPRASVSVGFVASATGELPLDGLRLEAISPSYVYTADEDAEEALVSAPALPEVTLTGTEPLLSPDGYRLRYLVDAPEAVETQISVLFRDDEGRLLGGVPAEAEPFNRFRDAWAVHRFPVPAGESLHHVDVPLEWIPEGADPDRFEVGPST